MKERAPSALLLLVYSLSYLSFLQKRGKAVKRDSIKSKVSGDEGWAPGRGEGAFLQKGPFSPPRFSFPSLTFSVVAERKDRGVCSGNVEHTLAERNAAV